MMVYDWKVGVVCMVWISPNYRDTDFPHPLSLDNKITVFLDRISGWQLDIADKCINGEKDPSGNIIRQPLTGAGFATLSIVLSYFEMIAKHRDGFQNTGRSEHYFKEGVRSVFPILTTYPRRVVDDLLDALYKGTRCGLYHCAITNSKILLTGETRSPMVFKPTIPRLIINPHLLVPVLKNHLETYGRDLRNTSNTQLRQDFEARFDYDSSQ